MTATVFALGAGAGVLITALTRGSPRRAIVTHRAARVGGVSSRARSVMTAPSVSSTAPSGATGPAVQAVHTDPSRPRPSAQDRPGSLLSASVRSSFAALAPTLGGTAGLAIAPLGEGPVQTLGELQIGHAWSTMKVPVLTTLLAYDERSEQVLSAEERTDAQLALEQSDNAAAEALFTQLERLYGGLAPASEAVQQTLARAGDTSTRINTAPNDEGFTTWGQSLWSPTGEVLFYRALARGCLLSGSDTEYVLGLMRDVIPSQRWGAGEAGYPSTVPLGFKGGWGPENGGGYLVRQTAIVGSGDTGYVLSMIALPDGGAFTEGTAMLTAIASWAQRHLPIVSAPSAQCAN